MAAMMAALSQPPIATILSQELSMQDTAVDSQAQALHIPGQTGQTAEEETAAASAASHGLGEIAQSSLQANNKPSLPNMLSIEWLLGNIDWAPPDAPGPPHRTQPQPQGINYGPQSTAFTLDTTRHTLFHTPRPNPSFLPPTSPWASLRDERANHGKAVLSEHTAGTQLQVVHMSMLQDLAVQTAEAASCKPQAVEQSLALALEALNGRHKTTKQLASECVSLAVTLRRASSRCPGT